MPAVVSDYVPRGIQVPVRAGVLGLSVLTAVGLTKLALTGAVALPPILPLGPFRQPAADIVAACAIRALHSQCQSCPHCLRCACRCTLVLQGLALAAR